MSAAPAWRQFAFFDVSQVTDTHDIQTTPHIFKAALELSCLSSSSAGVLVADIHGSIHLLDPQFEPITSWVAHSAGHVTHMAEQNGTLVTIGEEPNSRGPILKVFDLTGLTTTTRDPKSASAPAPPLLRSVKLSNHAFPVSSIALALNLAHFAIGFADGTVLLYRHLDQSLASSSSLTALPKVRTAHEPGTGGPAGSEPVTGLGFKQPSDDSPNAFLFIVTTSHVLCYQVSGKGSGAPASIVDEIGTGLGCARMDWKARDVVVARPEAIYLCGTDGRGACYAYEGQKSSIHTHRHYIVIVSPPFTPTAQSTSTTVRHYVGSNTADQPKDVTKVVIFDLENKYVAYTGAFPYGVRDVVSQWDRVYLLTNDGQLFMFQEKPTQEKLDILYRKSLYLTALSLAKTQNLDEGTVAEIHRQYGDHLYSKADYDGAMQQYLHTIGHVQASYVIRRFLDSQRINNLVTYLQELHTLGRANADHTTLLLNTYTKLKDVARLDGFIKLETKRGGAEAGETVGGGELPFDLDTAIRVCRQAGYFDHASYLAKKYNRHEDYLSIQIEDARNYAEALAYLRMLGSDAAEGNLARYGRALLDNLPVETTGLLIDLCTTTGAYVDPPNSAGPTGGDISNKTPVSASYLSYLGLSSGSGSGTETPQTAAPDPASPSTTRTARQEPSTTPATPRARRSESVYEPSTVSLSRPGTPSTVGPVSRTGKPPPPVVSHTRVATVGHQPQQQLPSQQQQPPPPLLLTPAPASPPRKPISPRLYFAHFVDHMEQFLVFLETVAVRRWGQTVDEEGVKIVPSLDAGETVEVEAGTEIDPESQVEKQVERADQVAVWNTLLELYLTLPAVGLRKKAINILKSDVIPYDPTHALVLCSGRGYTEGMVLLWERLGMYEDVVRFWMNEAQRGAPGDREEASRRVVSHLHQPQYGPSHPRLYLIALRFLTSTPELLARHQTDVKAILERIDKEGILPPLGVIQVLSRNNVASVGLVKEWLVRRIKDARDEIRNDQTLTQSYRSETAKKLRQVGDLSNRDQPRVFHVTRCSACSGQLDLPSVHFMCDHSYHQRCLGEHDTECPSCVREHSLIREIRRNNERLAEHHDVFVHQVKENGFDAVAAAFGSGVLNVPRMIVDEVV
ncbi:hypothetical protein APHAL10511_007800 [Amanita phalloides]|nr:hypothetical protein APHAL10511_007800 [Amanita phalloides]